MPTPINVDRTPTQIYESKQLRANIDLIVKKVAIAVIIAANVAALASVYTYVVHYSLIEPVALFNISFFIGMLASLKQLEVHTYSIETFNFFQYVNPVTVIGRALTYALVAPSLYLINKMDLTDYADPKVANQITNHLENHSFKKIALEYGSHLNNLQKYGLIDRKNAKEIKNLYKDYRPVASTLKKLKKYHLTVSEKSKAESSSPRKNPLAEQLVTAQNKIIEIETTWKTIQEKLRNNLPTPDIN